MPLEDKKKKSSPKVTSEAGLPYSPEALVSLLQQQSIKRPEEWKPSVINYQASGVPSVQTQLAGTDYYDTTGNQFVAPSYEHLKDLSVKRSLEADEQKSSWNKFMSTADSFDPGTNESYKTAAANIKEALVKHDDNLKQGMWSQNNDLISQFSSDIVDKKGLGQLMSIKAAKAEADANIKELSGAYNPIDGGGIAPEALAYWYANSGKSNDAIFDKEGNMINKLSFTPASIYEHRNLPKEIDSTVDKIKSSSRPVVGKNGEVLYSILTDQYGMTTREEVTAEQIQAKVSDYMYNNGGDAYLQQQAKIAAFNNMGNATLEGLRAMVQEGAEREQLTDKAGGKFTKLLKEGDQALIKNAEGILAANEFYDMKSSLIGASVAANAFTKDTYQFFKDDDAIDEKNHQRRLTEARAKGESIEALDTTPKFSFYTTASESVQFLNPENAYNVQTRLKSIDESISAAEVQLKNLETSGKTDNAQYGELKRTVQALKAEEKTINDSSNAIINGYGNYLWETEKISFNQLYQNDYLPSVKGNPVDRDYFFRTVTAAIAAETDDDPKTTGESVLSKSKIGITIKGNRRDKGIGKYNRIESMPGSSYAMGTDSGKPYINDDANLLNMVTKVGKNLRDAYKDNQSNSVLSGKKAPTPNARTLQSDIVYLNPIIGATEKDPEAKYFNDVLSSISKQSLQGIEGVTMYDMSGKTGIGLSSYMNEKYKITPEIFNEVFDRDLNQSEVLPTTTQTYGKNGQIAYSLRLKLNNVTDSMSGDAKKAIERIKADIGNNTHFETRINLGRNQDSSDKMIGEAVKGLYMKNLLSRESIPPVIMQQAALVYGNVTGINAGIDAAKINSLDTSPAGKGRKEAVIKANGKKFIVQAFSSDNKSKMFTMELEQDGQRKFITFDEKGDAKYHTQAEINASKGTLEKKVFNNDLDVKAFINMGLIEDQLPTQSFNKGGATNATASTQSDFNRATAPTYKNTVTLANGKTVVQNTYVPTGQLVDLTARGIKALPSAGIPMVRAEVADAVENVFKTYGLSVGGGLRTVEHKVKGSAKNSKHYEGYSLDIANDANSAAFIKKIIGNKKLQQQLGIEWANVHDRGSGNHLHLDFARGKNPKKDESPTSNGWASSLMNAIGQGESNGNADIGAHYADKKANSSAYGKYGFTDFWYKKMAKYYNKTEDQVRKDSKLVDNYAKTQYIEEAKKEINPIFTEAKTYLRRFIPTFDMTDAMLVYHYAGGEFLKQLAKGRRSLYEIPHPEKGNKLSIIDYIKDKRKYI